MAKKKTTGVSMETLSEKEKRLYENILKIESSDPSIKQRSLEKFLQEVVLEGEDLNSKGYTTLSKNKKRWANITMPIPGEISSFEYLLLEAKFLDTFSRIEDYLKSVESLEEAWDLLVSIKNVLDFKRVYMKGSDTERKNKKKQFAEIKQKMIADFKL